MSDARAYPDRPYLAVSAAIIRDGHVLIVRRATQVGTDLGPARDRQHDMPKSAKADLGRRLAHGNTPISGKPEIGAAEGLHTLPGGVVEAGETLIEAVRREVREETGIEIEPVAIAGHREMVMRDPDNRVERHFVILAFAARWLSGEPVLNEELSDARWLRPSELHDLKTTEGLAEIVAQAFERLDAQA